MGLIKWPEALPRSENKRFRKLKSLSSWFEIYQINQDTFALLEPNHDEEVFSYLVLGKNKAALIDTGMGIGNIKKEIKQLTNLPIIVINTHNHFDHTGGNHQFNEVWAFDIDYEVARIEKGHNKKECSNYMAPSSYMNLPKDFNPNTYSTQPSQVTRRLQHKEIIDLGDRTLQVHHTPGHTPGSICLLENRDKILFTGDTVYPGTLILFLEGANFEDYVSSIQYLVSNCYQISHICPAHNEAYAPKSILTQILESCGRISSGLEDYEVRDSTRLYEFDKFLVRLPLD